MGLIWSSDDVPGHNPGMFIEWVHETADPPYDPNAWEYVREYVPSEELGYETMQGELDEEDWMDIDNKIAFAQTADLVGSARILKACLEGDKVTLHEVIRKSWDTDWLMLISQYIQEDLFDEWACDFIQARIDNIKLSREIQAAKKAAAEKKKPIIVQAAQGFMPTPVRKGTHLILARTQKFLDAKLQEGYEVIGG